MRQELERRQAKLVKKIAALARSRRAVGTNGSIGRFVGLYYEHVPPRDMVEQVPENLLGAALSHWTLAGRRKPGEAKVRVYNPSPGTDGWTAEHTVVEIVTDDMPFLVDSVTAALHREDVRVHLVIHPMVRVRRAKTGRLSGLAAAGEGTNESFMHVEITAQSGDRLDAIRATVERVVGDVRAAVEDWPTMRRRLQAIIDEVASRRRRTSAADLAEALDFLQWIHDDQFTFLGYRDYDVKTVRGRTKVVVDAKIGLGILRDPKVSVFRELRILGDMPTEVRAFAARPDILMVTKANLLSTVHRPVHLDAIGVKKLDAKGRGRRPTPVRRALYVKRLPPQPARDPASQAQDLEGLRPRRLPAGEPRRQGPAQHPGDLPARRTVPDVGRSPLPDQPRHPQPAGTPRRGPVHPPRRFRALPVVPRLPSPATYTPPICASVCGPSWKTPSAARCPPITPSSTIRPWRGSI